jgi:hypothetical protein
MPEVMKVYRGRAVWRQTSRGWQLDFNPPLDAPGRSHANMLVSAPPPFGPEEQAVEFEFTPLTRGQLLLSWVDRVITYGWITVAVGWALLYIAFWQNRTWVSALEFVCGFVSVFVGGFVMGIRRHG